MFGTKSKAPAACDRNQFYTLIQTQDPARADYNQYKGVVGEVGATYMLGMLFERCVRMKGPDGNWSAGAAPDKGMVVLPTSTIGIKTVDLPKLNTYVSTFFMGDLMKINGRKTYIATLLQKCRGGLLTQQLNNGNVEPEGNYYTAPPPPPVIPGRPAIPAKPAALVNQAKALAWVKQGVRGSTDAYQRAVMTHVKPGQFPLGTSDRLVAEIWTELTRGDNSIPAWRDMNPATPYPSSVGGRYLLKNLLGTTLAGEAWPPAGDARWQDWSLFMLGALMTMQAFPDANKRVTRTVYAIMMCSGQVPFVAPNARYGGELAAMM